jgi:hypothetical protein
MTDSPHLTPEEAARLVAFLPLDEREVLDHVLDCPPCRDRVVQLLADPAVPPAAAGPLPPEYAAVLDRLESGLAEETERMAAERSQAAAAVAGLLAAPAEERHERIRSEARLHTLAVAALLLEKTAALAVSEPEEAERLGLLALSVVARLDPVEVSQAAIGELMVRGWALLSRARWQRGDWVAVREAIEHAEEVLVMQGYLTKRSGFRRAVAGLRQAERQMEEILTATAGALDLLVAPLLPRGAESAVESLGPPASGEAPRSRAVPRLAGDEPEN